MKSKGWYGIDLDHTMALYDRSSMGMGDIGEPIKPMIDFVNFLLERGDEVRVFTARAYLPPEPSMRDYEDHMAAHVAIENFCMEQYGKRLTITCMKDPYCIRLFDDIAVGIERDTGRFLNEPHI